MTADRQTCDDCLRLLTLMLYFPADGNLRGETRAHLAEHREAGQPEPFVPASRDPKTRRCPEHGAPDVGVGYYECVCVVEPQP